MRYDLIFTALIALIAYLIRSLSGLAPVSCDSGRLGRKRCGRPVRQQRAMIWSILPTMAGLSLGNRIHVGISTETMFKILGVVLMLNGVLLIAKVIL